MSRAVKKRALFFPREFRQKSDYGDFVEFEEEKVRQWLETAERFMKEIEGVIEKEAER